MYDSNALSINGFSGSWVDFIVKKKKKKTEYHAQAGRYMSTDEHPCFPNDLLDPILPPLQYQRFFILLVMQLISTIIYGKCIIQIFFDDWSKKEMMGTMDRRQFVIHFGCWLFPREFITANSLLRQNIWVQRKQTKLPLEHKTEQH